MSIATAAPHAGAPSAEWAIDAEGLVKVFGTNRAVDGVDLHVK